MEEAVDRRAGAAEIGPERARRAQLAGEWRAARRSDEIVGRQRGEIARAPDRVERSQERRLALREPGTAAQLVEACVDLARRLLRRAAREREQDPEVLRDVERAQPLSGALGQLRPGLEEERDVGAEAGGKRVEALAVERPLQPGVGEPQRGGGVGAPAAQAGGDGDLLRDPGAPSGIDLRLARELDERAPDDRVVLEALDREPARPLELDAVADVDALEDGDDLVQPVGSRARRRRGRG